MSSRSRRRVARARTTLAMAVVGGLAGLLAVGCGSGDPPARASIDAEQDASTTVAPVTAPPATTLEAPAPMGTSRTLAGYEVTVTAFAPDATAVVQGADARNLPPDQGRYATATLTVVNRDVDPAVPSRDLSVLLVGGDGSTARHWDCAAHLGERALFDGGHVHPGGRVSGDVCIDLAPEASAGARIVVTSAEDPLSEADTWFWGT